MATELFFRNTTNSGISGHGDGTVYDLLTTPGTSVDTAIVNTATGPSAGIQLTKTAGGSTIAFVSGRTPAAGFTLTALTIISLWGVESNMNANAGYTVRLYKRSAAGVLTELGGSPFADDAEISSTGGGAEHTWTANPTDMAFAENDRLFVRIYIDDAPTLTMAATYNVTFSFNAAVGATGDSSLTLAETVAFKAEPAVGFDQDSYRLRNDNGSETTATWVAAANTPATLNTNTKYRARILVQSTGELAAADVDLEWQYNLAGAGWNNITTSSPVVSAVSDSGNIIANGANCTQQLGSGTFVTTNAGFTEDGTAGGTALDPPLATEIETELCFVILAADVTSGQQIQLRLVRDGGIVLNTYTNTPTITAFTAARAQLSWIAFETPEGAAGEPSGSVSEAGSATDSSSTTLSASATTSDAASATDSASRTLSASATQPETASATETPTASLSASPSLSESATAAETASGSLEAVQPSGTVPETATAGESTSTTLTATATTSDSATAGESPSSTLSASATGSESTTAAETASVTLSASASLSDAASATDNATASLASVGEISWAPAGWAPAGWAPMMAVEPSGTLAETATATETVSGSVGVAAADVAWIPAGWAPDGWVPGAAVSVLSGAVTESASASDSPTGTLNATTSQSEIAAATETPTSQLSASVPRAETGGATETMTVALTASASQTEPATATEALTRSLQASVSLSESASATESPSRTMAALASLQESATALDAPEGTTALPRSTHESATALDAPTATLQASASRAEAVSALETPTTTLQASTSRPETASATETVTGGLSFAASLSESASALESLDASVLVIITQPFLTIPVPARDLSLSSELTTVLVAVPARDLSVASVVFEGAVVVPARELSVMSVLQAVEVPVPVRDLSVSRSALDGSVVVPGRDLSVTSVVSIVSVDVPARDLSVESVPLEWTVPVPSRVLAVTSALEILEVGVVARDLSIISLIPS